MRVMVVGGGGREHAIVQAIKRNEKVEKLFALPGNGGMASMAECVDIGAKDIGAIVDFAVTNAVDFAIVAPDDPLVMGAVDRLHEAGVKCFGPTAAAAAIEGSKAFAKELMKKYRIPTADYAVFTDAHEAIAHIEAKNEYPVVIKADGLALGKGVVIAEDLNAARDAVRAMMEERVFGESGSKVVVEEFLKGPEVSVLCFTDGKTLVPMVSSMDHKRALDGDLGLNTGGMGAIAPNPFYTDEIAKECMETIFMPTIRGMEMEGRAFRGCLYFGLMLTEKGPRVIEYNCRFGDPETQVVLPLLQSDLLDIMLAVEEGRLHEMHIAFSQGAACCVVMASGGYPLKYQTGFPITIPGDIGALVYHAGTKLDSSGDYITSGGRVLGVTATGDTLKEAIENAYAQVGRIGFTGAFYRRDIGKRALLSRR